MISTALDMYKGFLLNIIANILIYASAQFSS